MKIYVASSWRNEERHQIAVNYLRLHGYEVYDFRNPEPGDNGFSWQQIDPDRAWLKDPQRYRTGLAHSVAQHGFDLDMRALEACDACVLVLPCGRSAHFELGWAAGAGKLTAVLLDNPISEPELMYLDCTALCVSMEEVTAVMCKGCHGSGRMFISNQSSGFNCTVPGCLYVDAPRTAPYEVDAPRTAPHARRWIPLGVDRPILRQT